MANNYGSNVDPQRDGSFRIEVAPGDWWVVYEANGQWTARPGMGSDDFDIDAVGGRAGVEARDSIRWRFGSEHEAITAVLRDAR